MDFIDRKESLNRDLEQFIKVLNELLPRYSLLMRQNQISDSELKELGEIEHFLIEVNSKITTIKNGLDQDLFGHSIDLYYKLKEKAKNGDPIAKVKFDRIRDNFNENLLQENLVNWN